MKPTWQAALHLHVLVTRQRGQFCASAKLYCKGIVLQAEAAKVAKVREAAIAKLKSLEKQKAEVEKTRDDIKCVPSRHFAVTSMSCCAMLPRRMCCDALFPRLAGCQEQTNKSGGCADRLLPLLHIVGWEAIKCCVLCSHSEVRPRP